MSWREKALGRLPNLNAFAFWWVEGNILIDDIGLKHYGIVASDIPSLSEPLYLLNADDLTDQLFTILHVNEYDNFIWPGEGSLLIRKCFGLEEKGLYVKAKRLGYHGPVADVEEFARPAGKLIVIDDVVSTGQTAYQVLNKGKLQNADLACWIIQYPKDLLLQCYQKIYASFLVRGKKGKVPINSLSTFLKRNDILLDYAQRHSNNPQDFMDFFSWLIKEGIYVL